MKIRKFWQWLFELDADGRRGLNDVFDHVFMVITLACLILTIFSPLSPNDFSSKAAIPASAVLIGLSFAWAGRVSSLLQDKLFSKFIIEFGPSPERYVYAFQLAILIVVTLIISSAMINLYYDKLFSKDDYFITKGILFVQLVLCSISIRECWGVINFVNELTIAFYVVRRSELEKESEAK